MTAATRKAKLALPRLNRSTTSLRYRAGAEADSASDTSESDDDGDDERVSARHRLTMNPAEIRVIKRLAARVNVLPIVARADSLTDDKLAAIKRAIRRDLSAAGISFGVFDSLDPTLNAPKTQRKAKGLAAAATELGETFADDNEEDAPKVPVIQIKKPRFGSLTRSRSKRNLQELDADMFGESRQPNVHADRPGSVTLDAAVTKNALVLPFAIVAPEPQRSKRSKKKAVNGTTNGATTNGADHADASADESVEGHTPGTSREERRRSTGAISVSSVPPSPTTDHAETGLPYMLSPQHIAMRGRFVRRYRWGTIDVLDPAHCDFASLRTAVFNTHMKALKANTKDVLYEQFRTEKLLARRATANINDADRQRLLEGAYLSFPFVSILTITLQTWASEVALFSLRLDAPVARSLEVLCRESLLYMHLWA